jgi:hypothetical protein
MRVSFDTDANKSQQRKLGFSILSKSRIAGDSDDDNCHLFKAKARGCSLGMVLNGGGP